MYPMDPQMYDFNVFTDLSADRQVILRQLSDRFYGVPLIKIRRICEECSWNVDFCIDKLISTDGENDREEVRPRPMNAKSQSYSNILQSAGVRSGANAGASTGAGAIPKSSTYGFVMQSKQFTHGLPQIYSNVYDNINYGYKVLILMRGAPGSGKSHLAKSIVTQLLPGAELKDFILSADDYFFDSLGRYMYRIDQLENAHNYCQTRAREKTSLGWSPIFIDNTNMQLWEMLPYVKVAVENGYMVELMDSVTPWRNSAGKLASKNVHNVSRNQIQRKLDSYEVGTTNDLLALLKQTKYKVSLPQLRSYPAPPVREPEPELAPQQIPTPEEMLIQMESKNIEADQETTEYHDMQTEQEQRDPFPDTDSWSNYENPVEMKSDLIPKAPRQNHRKKNQLPSDSMQQESDESASENVKTFVQEAANFWGVPSAARENKDSEKVSQLFPPVPTAWQTYELEASYFWGVPVTTPSTNSTTIEPMSTDQNESCGLLQLLKEGVKSINVPQKGKTSTDEPETTSNEFKRHRVGCENENQLFVSLRQIFPNKPITDLWDLFVKCNGSVDWAVDILLKDEDFSDYNNSSELIENCDNYGCGCDNHMIEPPEEESPSTVLLTEINVKPQRVKSARNRIPTADTLEAKEALERSFVLSDEHYSSHVKKIRNKRNASESPTQRKAFIDTQVQTEGDENDNISEGAVDDGSDILEINLGADLINQLCLIFKSETHTLTIPEEYKTNVFMPKSLARELYVLWMESLYNQMEEQRQVILKEDEDFARLLKNPKYENCKQPPENIKELLDMEFAWMIYKTEQEEYRAAATQHQQPNDLASHLTRMKLCEIFPNIPRETLLDVLAAHNNKFSDTVEVLKSSIQTSTIKNQVSADALIEKAINENEKLSKEVEQQEEEKFYKNNNKTNTSNFKEIHSVPPADDSQRDPRRRSLSPDEAKRLALKEFEEARNYAAHHCQLRAECYQKAKEAIQRGNKGVAVYYSHIANLHKKKIDIYNHRAANCIMEVHDLTQNNPDFIDLHYLHVIEAIACLDIFIDKHIAKLRSIFRSFKYVFIITGRGLHSTGGVSTIKTKVKSRLKERNLKWSEVNPGLLKVKIFSASKYAKNL